MGNLVITKRSNNTSDSFYLHKDHQGSTTTITDAAGNSVQQFVYDPWGKQTAVFDTGLLANYTTPATTKGYTGHEHISHLDLIHMNGRIYDATIGRFMQADPFIQAPSDTQSYNRYSYVKNNPMSYTDPSGFFLDKLWKGIKKYWRPIVAIVAAVVTYGAASGWAGAWGWTTTTTPLGTIAGTGATINLTTLSVSGYAFAGAAAGAVAGGIMTGSLSGAAKGALTGAITGGVTGALSGTGTGLSDSIYRLSLSAVGGCAAGAASGGSCNQGAKLAVIAQGLKIGMDYIAKTNTSLATSQGEAVVKPGGDLKAKLIEEGRNVDWLNEGVDNTGMGVTVSAEKYRDLVGLTVTEAKIKLLVAGVDPNDVLKNLGVMGESSPIMSFLSQNIPGVRGASITHDSLVGMTERALGMEDTWYGTVFTIGSIPPAFVVQYGAYGIYSYDYYYKNMVKE